MIEILESGGNMALASLIITMLLEHDRRAEMKPRPGGAWEVHFADEVVLVNSSDDLDKLLPGAK